MNLQRGRGSLAEARLVALADLQGPQSGTARGLAARARAAWRAGGSGGDSAAPTGTMHNGWYGVEPMQHKSGAGRLHKGTAE